jgi:exopolysaccharide biosynthesis polyprenyl glycosylphosphotransferase
LTSLTLATVAAAAVDGSNVIGPWTLALFPLYVFVAKAEGLYDNDHTKIRHLGSDEAAGIFHWVTICTAITALLLTAYPPSWITPLASIVLWLSGLACTFTLRAAVRALWRRIVPPDVALVIGSGQLADALARKLVLEPGHHVRLARYFERENGDGDRVRPQDLSSDEFAALISGSEADRLVLAVPDLDERVLSNVVSACRSLGTKLSVAPPLRAMLGTAVQLNHIAELPLIEYRTWEPSRTTMAIKRIVDIIVAAAALIVFAPILLVVAVAIKLDSAGPAFFLQLRAGQKGVPFRVLKFRTMVRDAEQQMSDIVRAEDLVEPMFKLRDDPRITTLGRFLRRWSIDELPQLVNVLFGQMSLVGPRPEALWLVERYGETERFRLEMKPGITGPMQIHGRGELTFQERLAVEREYVENYSFRKDVRVLLRTFAVVVRGRGAF